MIQKSAKVRSICRIWQITMHTKQRLFDRHKYARLLETFNPDIYAWKRCVQSGMLALRPVTTISSVQVNVHLQHFMWIGLVGWCVKFWRMCVGGSL